MKEKKARGAPSTATGLALEILKAVLLKEPDKQGSVITPADWLQLVKRVNLSVPEWQKSDQTLKDYLKEVLVEAGKVERFSAGFYRIL